MNPIDWIVLGSTLALIVSYGIIKTRHVKTSESFLRGDGNMRWWLIGISIMATQASAITFLSTPGQAYADGMSFVQFYFGLPLAMIILCIFVLPLYYRLKVYTAYEFLENRFDLKTRTLTSILFLIQRGLAAGITIYAPSIILSTILGWNLNLTNVIIGFLVILYTVAGGTIAVSQTQKQQMIVIMTGMFLAFFYCISLLPENTGFGDAMFLAGETGKLNVIDFNFDLSNRYNVWSGLIGGTFLFLSYFGTDQSQVQRYLSGRSLTESRMGLMFNGLFKIPMQFFILLVGVMVFVFFQFNDAPLHYNPANTSLVMESNYAEEFRALEDEYQLVHEEKRALMESYTALRQSEGPGEGTRQLGDQIREKMSLENEYRDQARDLINRANPSLDTKDTDYVFITFVLNYLPVGLIGLLLAVIFSAAMSSTASELNALATTSIVDIYKRFFGGDKTDGHYLSASKYFTILWGLIALAFATFASLFENLIQAVNIIGSLFYGAILGVFVVAFFMKHIKGKHVFPAALIAEALVITIYLLDVYDVIELSFLWLNLIGCVLVMIASQILYYILRK
ncbi:MAG: sodium:solute symporter [Saprospirales bacterium]|nr:MAG: sodium:solute symporter [Saprospirales bacterium]